MKRRQFTQTIALMACGAALPAYAGIPSALDLMRIHAAPKDLSRDFFEARIGNVFQLRHPGSRTLLLKGVEDACGPAEREQFHAVFELSPGTRLEEGIFQLERERIGWIDLFLTESDQSRTRQQFVAIINLQTTA
jgi:hypothetical protein